MFRKIALSLVLFLSACEFCVENAVRVVGGDAVCEHGGPNTVVCYSKSRGKGYVCFASNSDHGNVTCLEGLPPQPEASR